MRFEPGKFRNENQDISDDFFGDALERANRQKKPVEPKPEDFNLPRNKAEWETMLAKMKDCGIEDKKAVEIMRERIQKYENACLAFKSSNKWVVLLPKF